MSIRITVCALVSFAAAPVCSAAVFFTSQPAFESFMMVQGKALKFIEDFEESTIEPFAKIPFPNPLMHGLPRPSFPNGIDATNLIIQSNITPGPTPPAPNPSGNPNALFVNGAGAVGDNSIKVGNDEFLNGLITSLDLIFTTDDKTGVGLDVSRYNGFGNGGFIVSVHDHSEAVLGVFVIPGPVPGEPAKNFFGIWSPVPIGRVNIWDDGGVPSPFAIDNVQMWVIPTPGGVALLGLAGIAAVRRRRS